MEISAAWSWSCTVATMMVVLVIIDEGRAAAIDLPSCDKASTIVDLGVPSCVSISCANRLGGGRSESYGSRFTS